MHPGILIIFIFFPIARLVFKWVDKSQDNREFVGRFVVGVFMLLILLCLMVYCYVY